MASTRSEVGSGNEDNFSDAREDWLDSPDGAQKRNRPGSVEPSPAHKLQHEERGERESGQDDEGTEGWGMEHMGSAGAAAMLHAFSQVARRGLQLDDVAQQGTQEEGASEQENMLLAARLVQETAMQQESELCEQEQPVKNLTQQFRDCGSEQANVLSTKQAEAAADCSGVQAQTRGARGEGDDGAGRIEQKGASKYVELADAHEGSGGGQHGVQRWNPPTAKGHAMLKSDAFRMAQAAGEPRAGLLQQKLTGGDGGGRERNEQEETEEQEEAAGAEPRREEHAETNVPDVQRAQEGGANARKKRGGGWRSWRGGCSRSAGSCKGSRAPTGGRATTSST